MNVSILESAAAAAVGDNDNDNEDFVRVEKRQSNARRSRIKRATVVGNPMFSSEPSQDPRENMDGHHEAAGLSLDDLDMDYEQIMQYFDNLKVSEMNVIHSLTYNLINSIKFPLFSSALLQPKRKKHKSKGIKCLNP